MTRANTGKRPNRAFLRFERLVLSVGMTAIAVVLERMLLRALKSGGIKPSPKVAATNQEVELPTSPTERPQATLGTAAKQVGDQAGGERTAS